MARKTTVREAGGNSPKPDRSVPSAIVSALSHGLTHGVTRSITHSVKRRLPSAINTIRGRSPHPASGQSPRELAERLHRNVHRNLQHALPSNLPRTLTGVLPRHLTGVVPRNLISELADRLPFNQSDNQRSCHPTLVPDIAHRVPSLTEIGTQLQKMAPLLPIGARVLSSVVQGSIAVLPLPASFSAFARHRADQQWSTSMQDLQEFFFDNPWMSPLPVHVISRVAWAGNWTVRHVLGLMNDIKLGDPHQHSIILEALQNTGYRSFMATYLRVGVAMGYFRGGPVHVRLVRDGKRLLPVHPVAPFLSTDQWDDAYEAGLWPDMNNPDHPLGRKATARNPELIRGRTRNPLPTVFGMRRFNAPHTLADTIADLDDLYWSSPGGMVMKIVAIGTYPHFRWVVIVPGTDHMALVTMANPADTESNIREMLGMRSAARAGVERALSAAMDQMQVPDGLRPHQEVLIVGHSQGGVTAHALAADPRHRARVTHVLTVGSPSRAIRIPSGVRSVSVEHVQDCIPWMDGVTDDRIDNRVIIRRELDKPRDNPLYYAHSAGTYLDTVSLVEDDLDGQPDRVAKEVRALQSVLPLPGEETRVLFYEIAQEVLEWAPDPSLGGHAWITYMVPATPETALPPNHLEPEIVASTVGGSDVDVSQSSRTDFSCPSQPTNHCEPGALS